MNEFLALPWLRSKGIEVRHIDTSIAVAKRWRKPQVRVRLGSIHSVKGETHTATLVLDSYYHRHHLSELKPWLLGKKSGGTTTNRKGNLVKESTRMLGRLRLHYVAMTRPTHLLCLAMRWDAFEEGELDILVARGWTVIDCRDARPTA